MALAKAQMLARQLGSTMPNGAVAAAVAAASGQGMSIMLRNMLKPSEYINYSMLFVAGSGFNPLASIFFQEEMDINDYPVNARRRLNLKKTIDDIHERTGSLKYLNMILYLSTMHHRCSNIMSRYICTSRQETYSWRT